MANNTQFDPQNPDALFSPDQWLNQFSNFNNAARPWPSSYAGTPTDAMGRVADPAPAWHDAFNSAPAAAPPPAAPAPQQQYGRIWEGTGTGGACRRSKRHGERRPNCRSKRQSIHAHRPRATAAGRAPGRAPSRPGSAEQLAEHDRNARQPRQGDDARRNRARERLERPAGAREPAGVPPPELAAGLERPRQRLPAGLRQRA